VIVDLGENRKSIVQVYRDGAGYRFRVPNVLSLTNTLPDFIRWWGGLYQTEEEARDHGCKRARIANQPKTWEYLNGSGETRFYPPQ